MPIRQRKPENWSPRVARRCGVAGGQPKLGERVRMHNGVMKGDGLLLERAAGTLVAGGPVLRLAAFGAIGDDAAAPTRRGCCSLTLPCHTPLASEGGVHTCSQLDHYTGETMKCIKTSALKGVTLLAALCKRPWVLYTSYYTW